MRQTHKNFFLELAVRVTLFSIYWVTDEAEPFERKIQAEEMWLYRYPKTPSYYPGHLLWVTVMTIPTVVMGLFYFVKRDRVDFMQGIMGVFLSVFLAGAVTNALKLAIGRPRPDYLARCFPGGVVNPNMVCTGKVDIVREGKKSFPSGHSTLAFSCLAFVALYIAGKFHVFGSKGRGNSLKLVCAIVPVMWATLIAASRTADYHHHWQDVLVGSMIGLSSAYLTYRQYYPALSSSNSHLPYAMVADVHDVDASQVSTSSLLPTHNMNTASKLV